MRTKVIRKQEIDHVYEILKPFKGLTVYGTVNSVSRSGMSRRIEFYVATEKNEIRRIGYYIAKIAGYPYNVDKGGILVNGCGMDMLFSVLSNFNYAVAQYETGKNLTELLNSGEYGRIYDDYFFDANYRSL